MFLTSRHAKFVVFAVNLPIGGLACQSLCLRSFASQADSLRVVAAVFFILPRTPAKPLPAPVLETIQGRANFVSRGKLQLVEGTLLHKMFALDWIGTILLL